MSPSTTQVEYFPNRQQQLGLRVWAEMFAELRRHRGLVWQLCVRDVSARYKQSVLGIAWALLLPLTMMLLFTLLNRARVLPIGPTPVPYPLFVYVGLLSWQLFAKSLTLGTQSIVANISVLSQIKVPGEAFVLASLGQALFEFLMGLVVLTGLFVWYGVVPGWTVVFVPLLLVVVLLTAAGLGFLLGLANAALRDVSNMLPMLTTLWLFATPVIYPVPTSWPWCLVSILNPLSPLIANIRSLTLEGRWVMGCELAASVVFSILTLLVGWRLFHLLEPKIAERL